MTERQLLREPFPYVVKPDKFLTVVDIMEQEGLSIEAATRKLAEMRVRGAVAISAFDHPDVNPARARQAQEASNSPL